MDQRKERGRIVGKLAALMAAGMLAVSLAACSTPPTDEAHNGAAAQEQAATRTVTDMVGRSVEVPAEADKIIGIGSSSLRLISYLDAVDKVVGVEQSELEDNVTCSYRHVNHDTFKDLPVIGDGGSKGTTPNEEAIMQVAPDVIFASIDKDAADALQEKTGIPVVCLTLSDIVFDQVFYDNVNLMGDIVGKRDRAEKIVTYMQDTQADLEKRTAGIADADRITAYAAGISFRGGHGFAGTEAHFPPFEETNVQNIADVEGANGAFDIDLEKVAAAQPDCIFVEGGNSPSSRRITTPTPPTSQRSTPCRTRRLTRSSPTASTPRTSSWHWRTATRWAPSPTPSSSRTSIPRRSSTRSPSSSSARSCPAIFRRGLRVQTGRPREHRVTHRTAQDARKGPQGPFRHASGVSS